MLHKNGGRAGGKYVGKYTQIGVIVLTEQKGWRSTAGDFHYHTQYLDFSSDSLFPQGLFFKKCFYSCISEGKTFLKASEETSP